MRRLLDRLLSRWYVRREHHLHIANDRLLLRVQLEKAHEMLKRDLLPPDTFYVDAAGNYWPVAPTITSRGTPCH